MNWTPSGGHGAVLGAPLIGVLPVTQPGANAPAALFGFGNTGLALRNYVPSINDFGATGIGFSAVFDAMTAGGSIEADTFVTASPTDGIMFYAFDPVSELYGATSEILFPFQFPNAGQIVSAFLPTGGGPVLALSRLADGGTTSRLYVHQRAGGPATPLLTFGDAQARRLRCVASSGVTQACGATLYGGATKLFRFDPAAPTAVPVVQSVTTGAGSLGIAGAHRANGNLAFVVANFIANNINVIETTPDLATVVGNTTIPAPIGCTNPAHPAVVEDSEGLKAVVTCNGTNSYWVTKLFP